MAEYGVSTANIYDLLDDNASKKKSAPAKKVEEPKAAPARQTNNRGRSDKPARGRGGRGRGRGGGRGRGRGDRPGGKRDFDRRSGTGRGKEVAKQGNGKYNWGKDNGEQPAEAAAAPAEQETMLTLDDATATTEETPAQEPVPEEEVDNSMTFEEFQNSKVKVDAPSARGAEVDDSQWKSVSGFKKAEDDPFADLLVEKKLKSKGKKGKTLMHLDEFVGDDVRSSDRSDRRGGRGRGRGRGGRGNNNGRGYNSRRSDNVNLNDSSAFPKLG